MQGEFSRISECQTVNWFGDSRGREVPGVLFKMVRRKKFPFISGENPFYTFYTIYNVDNQ